MTYFFSGLRVRILLLVLFALIPAIGVIAYTAIEQRQQAATNAEQTALDLVRLVEHDQQRLISTTRHLLISFSKLAEVRDPRSAAACSRLLGELRKPYPYYANFAVAIPAGDLYCSALPLTRPVNAADHAFFQRTIKSRDFGVGNYQLGRVTGIHQLNVGQAILDTKGNLLAVVWAAIDLKWINELLTSIKLPPDSKVTVMDSGGTVLASYPDLEKLTGKSILYTKLFNLILANQQEETAEIEGPDGVTRFYAFAPLHRGPSDNVYVSVGISQETVYADANKNLIHNMMALFIVIILALIVAWYAADVFIIRRVRLLHHVNRALLTANAGNRITAQTEDRLTLPDVICRTITQRGGYRCVWIAYAIDNKRKSILPIAQSGFTGGIDALARIVDDMTWANAKQGLGLAATAIRNKKPHIVQNILRDPNLKPWHKEAVQRGFAAGAAFPLSVNGQIIGAVTIYSEELDAFQKEETDVLAEFFQSLDLYIPG